MRFWLAPAALFGVICLLFAPTSLQAQEAMGEVAAVEGTPSASGPGGSRRLSAGSAVFEGDRINVGPAGNAQLVLDDGTKLVVGPSSQLVLQSYLRRNESTANKVAVRALRGTFRFITGESAKSAYTINTSNATIGIRGTGFDFTVDSRTVAAVLEGDIRLRGRNGLVVNAAAGCGVAEAGAGSTQARELEGEEKSQALRNELPYVTDQSELTVPFHLPINNCLTSLGSNEGGSGAAGGAAAAGAVGIGVTIPAIIILTDDDEDEPLSPDGGDGCTDSCCGDNCD